MKYAPLVSGDHSLVEWVFVALQVVAFAMGLAGTSYAQAGAGINSPKPVADRNLVVVNNPSLRVPNAQRLALVIGNGAYKDAPLANPVNDARAIAQALSETGFKVSIKENVDQKTMLRALREFGDSLKNGGTGLFYFAGHGMQIKGRNYLIPVGASIEREDEVAYSSVDAQAVLDKMEAAGNVTNIMILDACRNNPFIRSTRGGQLGLAQMDAPVGTLVAYATAPGSVASDGDGTNSLYTQHLLAAIRQPGSKVEDVFKRVRANVRRDSKGKQVPWESTSLEGDFYFQGGPSGAQSASVQGGVDANLEASLWELVKGSAMPADIRVYLNRYPTGRFANEARQRLAKLVPQVVAVPDKDTIDVDKRTNELLAELSASPGKVNAPAPKESNRAGFTVGDRWRYQVVDKFKGEVVRNYSSTIDRFDPDGSIILNEGGARWDAQGNLRYAKAADRERTMTNYFNRPSLLKDGEKIPMNYEVDHKFKDGRTAKEIAKGEMVVKRRELVKTPAGEFNAWRIEVQVMGTTRVSDDTGGGYRWVFTGWYVPEIRAYVAFDDESRNSNGTFNRRERHELTSFAVQGAENFATH